MLDFQVLQKHFDIVKNAPPPKLKKPKAKQIEDEEVQPSSLTAKAKAAVKKAPPPPKKFVGPLIPITMTASSFLLTIVDKACQVKMGTPPSSSGNFDDNMWGLVVDAEGVLSHLLDEGIEENKPGSLNFAEALEAVATVCRCCSTDRAVLPLPSQVRAARNVVARANEHAKPWELAAGMELHKCGRFAMEKARQLSAIGLQDEAADRQLNALYDELETVFAMAFDDSMVKWARHGMDGGHFSTIAYGRHLQFVRKATVEVSMVMKQMSKARLEERVDDLSSILQALTGVVDITGYIAAKEFELSLMYGAGDTPMTVTESNVADQVTTLADPPQHSFDATDPNAPALSSSAPQGTVKQESTNEGAMTTARRTTTSTSTPSTSTSSSTGATIADFMEVACERGGEVKFLVATLIERLGGQFEQDIADTKEELSTATENCLHNKDALVLIAGYVANLSLLAASPSLDADILMTKALEQDDYLHALSVFCSAHNNMTSEPMSYSMKLLPSHNALAGELNIAHFVQSMVRERGQQIYDEHVGPATTSIVKALTDMSVQINTVHPNVVGKHPHTHELFGLLVAHPTSNILIDSMLNVYDGHADLTGVAHNMLFHNLKLVLEAIDVATLRVPGLRRVTSTSFEEVAIDKALSYLTVILQVRDVAGLAAIIHERFIRPVADAEAINDELLLDILPKQVSLHGDALATLEEILCGASVTSMESEGWVMQTSFDNARNFRENMAQLNGKVLAHLMSEWANRLAAVANEVAGTCPSWGACITEHTINEDLATELARGRLNGVVQAHNRLHNFLARLNDSAATLSITPKLPEHHLMKASIAIGMHSLASARSATIVIKGLQLLEQVRHLPAGPAQVHTFLKNVDSDTKANVPAAFWRHLSAFAAEHSASSPPTTSSNSAAMMDQEVKTEDAAHNEADADMIPRKLMMKTKISNEPPTAASSPAKLRRRNR